MTPELRAELEERLRALEHTDEGELAAGIARLVGHLLERQRRRELEGDG